MSEYNKSYVNGYNKALEDVKYEEMLKMLQRIDRNKTVTFDDLIEIKKLIKEATSINEP